MPHNNYKIVDAFLGMQDHQPVIGIALEQGKSVETFGPFSLHGLDMGRVLPILLRVCGARQWDQLKGKPVRVESDVNGVAAICHIVNDDRLTYSEMVNRSELTKSSIVSSAPREQD